MRVIVEFQDMPKWLAFTILVACGIIVVASTALWGPWAGALAFGILLFNLGTTG